MKDIVINLCVIPTVIVESTAMSSAWYLGPISNAREEWQCSIDPQILLFVLHLYLPCLLRTYFAFLT